jgi:hypothetical protein
MSDGWEASVRFAESCATLSLKRNTSAFVRTHLACFAKRRERAYYSHRAFTTCAVSSLGKAEELDERPHALFLTAGRKSFGS